MKFLSKIFSKLFLVLSSKFFFDNFFFQNFFRKKNLNFFQFCFRNFFEKIFEKCFSKFQKKSFVLKILNFSDKNFILKYLSSSLQLRLIHIDPWLSFSKMRTPPVYRSVLPTLTRTGLPLRSVGAVRLHQFRICVHTRLESSGQI